MKIIVNIFFLFLLGASLTAQSYMPDEFIIEYKSNTTINDRQAVRDFFGIASHTQLGDGIELWTGISFPIAVTENDYAFNINNVEELLQYIIEIQDGENGQSNTNRANISSGNLNYLAFLEEEDITALDGTFDPFPFCDDSHNSRVIGPDQSSYRHQDRIKVIIVDQLIPGIPSEVLASGPQSLGGSHGQKVYSVINNILTQAGITGVEYINLPVFDVNGVGTSAALIEIFAYISEQYDQGIWSTDDYIFVNFSANIIYPEGSTNEHIGSLEDTWEKLFSGQEQYKNIFLISAAGNQGIGTDNVFPGTTEYINEISVAGTQDCFSSSWSQTNHNATHYEIATEAVNILTYNGEDYQLSNGTSFGAPQVTASLIQTFIRLESSIFNFDLGTLKEVFLASMPSNINLINTVKNGLVLDISSILNYSPNPREEHSFGGRNTIGRSSAPSPQLTLQTTPNPFSQAAVVNISLKAGQLAQLSLYNSIGQLVHDETIPNQQGLTTLQWYTPDHLARGTYLLRVQVGEEVEQQILIKQ